MTGFRLTQISDTHLARRFSQLTKNFERLSDHIDTTRPDLVINSGDVAFDGTNPENLQFARTLHDALPVPCRYLPGNHDIGDIPRKPGRARHTSSMRRTVRPISPPSATIAGVSRPPAGALSVSTRW